jgi:nucleoside-diphosphate-sugar epimerase
MNIFVTGGTGFIGKHLVRALVKDGHAVTCLVRKTSKDVHVLRELGVGLHNGDITEKKGFGLDDFDAVFHLAGVLGGFRVRDRDYHRIHVTGTNNVLEHCTGQPFIYCSSAGMLGPVVNGDEESPLNPTNAYERSKAEAEALVREYRNHVIIRPEFVYGPHDEHVLGLFQSIKTGRFRTIGDGKSLLHPTYVGDVVQCLVASLGVKNETFMVAGERPVSVREFAGLVGQKMGVKAPGSVPRWLAAAYAGAVGPVAQLLSIDPVLTRTRLDFFTKSRTFRTDKAVRMLSYRPIGLEKGLERTIAWYRERGALT